MTTVDLLFLQGQAMNVKSLLTLHGSIDRNGLLFPVQSKLLSVSLFQNCIRLGQNAQCYRMFVYCYCSDFRASKGR